MFWVREVKRCSAARTRSLNETPARGVPVAVVVDSEDVAAVADAVAVVLEVALERVAEGDEERVCSETRVEAGKGDGGAEGIVRGKRREGKNEGEVEGSCRRRRKKEQREKVPRCVCSGQDTTVQGVTGNGDAR